MAQSYLLTGNRAAALRAADQVIQQSKDTGITFLAARAYVGAKEPQKALLLAKQLEGQLEADPQAYAKLIEAEDAIELREKQRSPRPNQRLPQGG